MARKTITTKEYADEMKVNERTVRKWNTSGKYGVEDANVPTTNGFAFTRGNLRAAKAARKRARS